MNLELNGTNVISESERSGKASSLFWPWCGANVSLLALSYGSFFLGFGISFWQATFAAIIGTVGSFLLVGVSSLAGKRANAPTMTLSRAAFGVKGNKIPGFLSYLIFVGWETVLVSLATLATGTIFMRIGDIDRNLAMVIGFVVAVSLTMYGGVLGHQVIMRLQKYLTLEGQATFSVSDTQSNVVIGNLTSGYAGTGTRKFNLNAVGNSSISGYKNLITHSSSLKDTDFSLNIVTLPANQVAILSSETTSVGLTFKNI